ncbi:MAG: hypothetical protein DI535_02440 [Citrobacter freundii]|nr:MAG: hypothetical protein DI535_02440 [Citrobacter freundii]
MELTAKLVQLLPLQTGSGKNGEWKKQDIIVETGGQYPKKVCISIWGDKINTGVLQVGKTLNISFDVESREYNGRWYTDVKAWKIEAAPAGGGAAPAGQNDDDVHNTTFSSSDDDLPF